MKAFLTTFFLTLTTIILPIMAIAEPPQPSTKILLAKQKVWDSSGAWVISQVAATKENFVLNVTIAKKDDGKAVTFDDLNVKLFDKDGRQLKIKNAFKLSDSNSLINYGANLGFAQFFAVYYILTDKAPEPDSWVEISWRDKTEKLLFYSAKE